MDPIKIIVTNSDTTYLTPPPPTATLYDQPRNAIEHSDSDYTKPNITHNATTNNNSAPKSKSSRRYNLPPLKISTNETKNTFKLPSDDDHIDVNDIQDDSQRLLLSPLLSKSLPVSRSTTSLNKRVKISPLLAAHRMESLDVAGKYYSHWEFSAENNVIFRAYVLMSWQLNRLFYSSHVIKKETHSSFMNWITIVKVGVLSFTSRSRTYLTCNKNLTQIVHTHSADSNIALILLCFSLSL